MSLMGKVCCGTNHSAQCDCLPSSISINIPSWSHNGYTYAGGTVIAYKCCFYYYDVNNNPPYNFSAYRINPIIVGTITANGCTSDVYFTFTILQSAASSGTPGPCNSYVESLLIYAIKSSATGCTPNVTIRNITALTACGGISNDNLCNFNNNYLQGHILTWWGTINNCTPPLGISYTSSSTYPSQLPNPCALYSSLALPFTNIFGTTLTFTIT